MTIESLYPFLYGQREDPEAAGAAVFAQLRSSTMEKAQEITALRRAVLARDGAQLAACAVRMVAAFAAGGRLFAFGNGGSSTDAADLASRFVDPGPEARPLPAYALADPAVLTALANDVGFDVAFARQLAVHARPGDIAVGLSTSGNSPNLIAAFDRARELGMLVIGLSGSSGGAMAGLSSLDFHFVMPSDSVHRIQEAQTTVYHVLWELTLTALGST